MCKLILIAAMVLAWASAQAAGSRGLTLASADEPAPAQQVLTTAPSQAVDAARPANAPQYADRPAAVSIVVPASTAAGASDAMTQPYAAASGKTTAKSEKPRHKRTWTEDQIIGELHRHGVYW